MRIRSASFVGPFFALLLLVGPGCDEETRPPGPGPKDGGSDAGSDGSVGPDGSVRPDGSVTPDAGPIDETCNNPPLVPPMSGTCQVVQSGGQGAILFKGDLVGPSGYVENGQLLIGDDGTILCAQCDCSSAPEALTATIIECAEALISPGLINPHEHISYDEGSPIDHGEERYEHRHDWREGQNGHTELNTPRGSSGDEGPQYAELRHLFGGATTILGAGDAPGLLRNLDRNTVALQEGLNETPVNYETFPLDDIRGEPRLERGCNYGSDRDRPTDSRIQEAPAYLPHVAEGIGLDARNEFLCMAWEVRGGVDLLFPKSAFIHGIGLQAVDLADMAVEGATLIWNPRTNTDLYGHTAQVTLAANLGVNIALGTDWPSSGSMNLLRELACAEELNVRNYNGFFEERDLIDMVTSRAAFGLKYHERIGSLKPGLEADITIFDAKVNDRYRAILDANVPDVVLVLRSGEPLLGDETLMTELGATTGCETLDVCGRMKRACVESETGSTISELKAAVRSETIDLFFCTEPPGEPTCVPFRIGEFDGIGDANDRDGDGVPNDIDNCPDIFNAGRPLDDMGLQADVDGDLLGDVCDPCPLSGSTTDCPKPDPDDRDGDMVPNEMDNCPETINPQQENSDNDEMGDACDRCPMFDNPDDGACPATVYQIKQRQTFGEVLVQDVVVTAVADSGYFVQVPASSPAYDPVLQTRFSGLYVFHSADPKPARGDQLDLEGRVNDYFGQMQLTDSSFTVLSKDHPIPPPLVVQPAEVATGSTLAAELESVLIEVQNVQVTDANPDPGEMFNEFIIDGSLRVNDFMHLIAPFPTNGQVFGILDGILRFANGESKLEPRDENDVDGTTRLVAIRPAFAFMEANSSGVPLSGFEVVLSRTATTPVSVSLASSSMQTTVPAVVTIPLGADRADITVTAGPTEASPVVITASYKGDIFTADLILYDDASPRTLLSLELERNAVIPSGTLDGRVEIDIPAASAGTTVSLTVSPTGLATVPASVTIPAGALETTFVLTAGANQGAGSLMGSIGMSSLTIPFDVSASVTRPPAAEHELIITEVHYNPSASDEHFQEWFEVHNPTTDTMELNGVTFQDNAGSHTLTTSETVPPGGYALIGYSLEPSENGGVTVAAAYGDADMRMSNGGDTLEISVGGMSIDRVDYSSSWPGGNGQAICLKSPYPSDNNDPAAWSDSVGSFGTSSDNAHPGIASDAQNCP